MNEARSLYLRGAAGAVRVTQLAGRDHYVVPVTALVEGVVHALNAPHPEYVPITTLQKSPQSWNGRPVVVRHPVQNGVQISANSPTVLEAQGIGTIFNAHIKESRLLMEAWIDKEKVERLDPNLARRLAASEIVEVSVGAFVAMAQDNGVFGQKAYRGRWAEIGPDHLAILPDSVGACSVSMGCGLNRAASANVISETGIEIEEVQVTEEHIRAAGGPGSGWTAENGHVKGGTAGAAHDFAARDHEWAAGHHKYAADALERKDGPTSKGGSDIKTTLHKEGESRAREGTKNALNSTKETGAKPYSAQAAKTYASLAEKAFKSGDTKKAAEYHREAAKMHTAASRDHKTAASWAKGGGKNLEGKSERQSLRERLTSLITSGFRAASPETELASEEKAELIGYQTLSTLLDAVTSNTDEVGSLIDDLISDEVDEPTKTAEDEAAESEVELARLDAIQTHVLLSMSALSNMLSQLSQLKSAYDKAYPSGDPARYAAGRRNNAEDQSTIQGIHDNSVSLGASCSEAMKTAAAHGCGCGGGGSMTKELRAAAVAKITTTPDSGFTTADVKTLEEMSDAGLKALETSTDLLIKSKTENASLAAKVTVLEGKKLTEEELKTAMPASMRSLLDRAEAAEKAQHEELVTKLKTLQDVFSEDKLKAMSLGELENVAKLVKVEVTAPSYAFAAGTPRSLEGDEKSAILNPPDSWAEAMKAKK